MRKVLYELNHKTRAEFCGWPRSNDPNAGSMALLRLAERLLLRLGRCSQKAARILTQHREKHHDDEDRYENPVADARIQNDLALACTPVSRQGSAARIERFSRPISRSKTKE